MDADYLSTLLLVPMTVATVLAFLAAFLVNRAYRHFGWLDDPKKTKHAKVIHTEPVPRGGGVVIFVSLLLSAIIFLPLDKYSLGILIGAAVVTLSGFLDDLRNLNPYFRLLLGFVSAAAVVAAGIGIPFITNPLSGTILHLNQPQLVFDLLGSTRTIWVLADIGALIWIVWSMNMTNWSKGLDGQLPGMVVIAALVIALLSFRFTEDVTQWNVSILAAIVAGAYLGFLPWNIFPQRMMPGYGGGALAGFLLAVLSILSGAKLATVIIVLGIPMIDAVYVMLRRLLQKRSPVWGDRSHFHHRLLDLGWSKRKIACFYWIATGILGLIALQLDARQKLFAILLLICLFGAALVWVRYRTTSLKQLDQDNG